MKKDVVILWLQKFSTACRNNYKYNLEYSCEDKIYSSHRLRFKMLHDTYTHSRYVLHNIQRRNFGVLHSNFISHKDGK
jgi:hypothetical protein